ncbi:MAG: DUF1854 domain-containing protein [Bacillota bacterium]|nr:DUF1854 domain-containing protein [Bacillota bacterium]
MTDMENQQTASTPMQETDRPDAMQSLEDKIKMRWLKPEDCLFSRTSGGFVRLDFRGTVYRRVAVHRCFPFSAPDEYISIRESDESSKEIGLILKLGDWDKDTQAMLCEQLELRYFNPKITRIKHVKEEYGYAYWDVGTDRGDCRFVVRMGSGTVIHIGSGRYIVTDVDGNRFEIPDIKTLSPQEMKRLDMFI